jgi:hypothetical protein
MKSISPFDPHIAEFTLAPLSRHRRTKKIQYGLHAPRIHMFAARSTLRRCVQ